MAGSIAAQLHTRPLFYIGLRIAQMVVSGVGDGLLCFLEGGLFAMKKDTYDIVIAGGGIMGCCTAYHLVRLEPGLKVAVVERDPTYTRASSTLSLANIRIQFSLEENIHISLYGMEVFERFAEEFEVDGEAPEIAFHQEGNLFMRMEAGRGRAQEIMELQRSLGGRVEWWDPEEVSRRYPLYRPDNYAGATFGPDDGHIDAYAALMGFRSKARALGAQFLRGEVTAITAGDSRVAGVALASGESLAAGCVVNCAGGWAAELARTVGVELPIAPTVRQVFALDTEVKPEGPLPLTNLASGLYFRTEVGDIILCGRSMDDDAVGFELEWERERFTDILWPELADFVPDFDRLKLVRGWAGLYAVNTFDGNALLGEWPGLDGLYLANGFSGHGLQQGPAVGRYIAELIARREPTLDLSIFSPARLAEGRRVVEDALV